MYVDYELLATLLGINAIGALGYYVTFSSGQFSMAHGAMFLIGGYAGGYLAMTYDLPLIATLVSAFVVAAAVGGALALALYRTRGLYFAVATLAFGGVVVEGAKHLEFLASLDQPLILLDGPAFKAEMARTLEEERELLRKLNLLPA